MPPSRYELSDVQWEKIKDFLPGRKEHVGPIWERVFPYCMDTPGRANARTTPDGQGLTRSLASPSPLDDVEAGGRRRT